MELSPSIHTRAQAAGMWQALLEEGVISHGKCLVAITVVKKSFYLNIAHLDYKYSHINSLSKMCYEVTNRMS